LKEILRGGKESDADAGKGGKREQDEVAGQEPADFTSEELQEFLEADRLDVKADPAFKERLRQKLWEIVRERAKVEGSDEEPH
jgi:hypothetical protein